MMKDQAIFYKKGWSDYRKYQTYNYAYKTNHTMLRH